MLSRRGLLGGLLAAVAAPAIIRTPGLLMPIRPLLEDEAEDIGGGLPHSDLYRELAAITRRACVPAFYKQYLDAERFYQAVLMGARAGSW